MVCWSLWEAKKRHAVDWKELRRLKYACTSDGLDSMRLNYKTHVLKTLSSSLSI